MLHTKQEASEGNRNKKIDKAVWVTFKCIYVYELNYYPHVRAFQECAMPSSSPTKTGRTASLFWDTEKNWDKSAPFHKSTNNWEHTIHVSLEHSNLHLHIGLSLNKFKEGLFWKRDSLLHSGSQEHSLKTNLDIW